MTKEIAEAGTESLAVKLSECSEQQLNEVLTVCGVVAGCNPPGQSELVILRDWLRGKHPNFTVDHVKRAFDYWGTGKLEIKFEHFGKLSGKFLSIVLNAFKPFITSTWDPKKALAQEAEKRPLNLEEVYSGMKGYVKMTGNMPLMGPWEELADWIKTQDCYNSTWHDADVLRKKVVQEVHNEAAKAFQERYVIRQEHYLNEHMTEGGIVRRMAKMTVLYYLEQFKLGND